MKHFESKPIVVNSPAVAVYSRFSDFNNMRNIMPDRVEEFSSTQSTCTFKLKGLPDITLDMIETVPNSKIVYATHDQKPVDIKMGITIMEVDSTTSKIVMYIDAMVDGVIGAMLSKPLQNMLDMMAEKLEKKI